jgi:hypothetical protein
MNNIITVKIKDVYGISRVYVTSEHANALKLLTGQETLSNNSIHALKNLGYEIKQVL